VFNQTYPNIEYIIVDGGSTDTTLDIVKKYESKLARWVSEKDYGIYDAMNKGIRMSNGILIGMINAGDYYEPEAVSLVIKALKENAEAGIFHGKIRMLDEKGEVIKVKTPQTDLSFLSQGMSLYHPTFFVRNDIYRKNGLYDTSFRIAADFDFALRNYQKGTVFHYVDAVISNFRIGGISHTQSRNGFREICDSLKKNGYQEETVNRVYKSLIAKDRKNNILFKGHIFLKKILPRGIVNRIANLINTAN
jgi:glycosyltransferase involved in cell wall biosynthesis